MAQIQRIGNDFNGSNFGAMSLFPGITLEHGMWQVNLVYVSYDSISHITTYHNASFMSHGHPRDFMILVGSDVRDIEVQAVRQNNFMTKPPTYLKYSMRVDRLFMLNLSLRLLASRLKSR